MPLNHEEHLIERSVSIDPWRARRWLFWPICALTRHRALFVQDSVYQFPGVDEPEHVLYGVCACSRKVRHG